MRKLTLWLTVLSLLLFASTAGSGGFAKKSGKGGSSDVVGKTAKRGLDLPRGEKLRFNDSGDTYITCNSENNLSVVVRGKSGLSLTPNSFSIIAPHLNLPGTVVFSDAFFEGAKTDTIVSSLFTANDIYFIQAVGQNVDNSDVLTAEALNGGVVIHRLSGGTDNLRYFVLRVL